MKKLLLTAAAVTVAGIAGLSVFGNHIQNTCVAGNADFEAGTGVCNAKNRAALEAPTAAPKAVKAAKLTNYEVCLKTQQDLIEFGGDPSEMDCEAVKNYKTPAQRIAAAGGQQRLIRGCEAILKPALNDPNSYRYLSGRITVPDQKTLGVTVNYTATNAFGGRVQGTYACTTNA